MKLKSLCLLSLLIFSSNFAFAEKTSEQTVPQWSKDLRRTEIITFGSLPFVTLWTTVGYGLAVHGTFHNPLNKSTTRYTQTEQKQIFAISAAASVGLGLTDLAINLIMRNVKKSRQSKIEKTIRVIPFSEQMLEIQNPEHENFEEDFNFEREREHKKEYLIGGLENAIF